jgi:DNA-binding NtrC family response regulator
LGTILVVEDDTGVRRFVRRVLEAAGYLVLTAPDGATAIEASLGVPLQLLLTDVVMPDMSGRRVAAKLAAERPGIRVLYMSGYPDDDIVRHGVLEPDIDLLAKPFTAEALLSAMDKALARGAAD